MSSETELGLVGQAVNLSEDQLISLVKEHNSISGQLSCPICLQLFNTPSRTKCGHLFCKDCITDHIQKNGKNVRCPLCNQTNLAKRSLVEDKLMKTLVLLYKELLQAERKDSSDQLDVTSLRIPRIASRESNGSPFRRKADKSLKNKYKSIATYVRNKPVKDESTIIFPGERLSGDESEDTDTENIFSRLSDPGSEEPLPKKKALDMRRLSSIKARQAFADLSDLDLLSQAPPGPAESTPTGTPSGTPVSTPTTHGKAGSGSTSGTGSSAVPTKKKFFKSGPSPGEKRIMRLEKKRLSREPSPAPMDLVTASQAVDVNDTFDKLFFEKKKPEEKKSSLKYITSETSLEESSYDSEGGVGADIIKKLRSQTPSIDESTPKQDNKGSARKLSMRVRRNKSGGKPTKPETKKVDNDMTIVNEKHTTNSSDSDDISFVGVSTEGGKGLSEMLQEAVLQERTMNNSKVGKESPQAGTSSGVRHGKPPRQTNFYGSQDSDVMLDEYGLPIPTQQSKKNEEYEFAMGQGQQGQENTENIDNEIEKADAESSLTTLPEVESFPSIFSATQSQKTNNRQLLKGRKSVAGKTDENNMKTKRNSAYNKSTSDMIQEVVDMEEREKKKALDKKFESFRSKVSTSDILAIPDPESMQLDPDDIECANENSEKSTKKEIEKSVTKTPTRQEGRVTRSRTPQGKKAKNNAGKLPNTPKDKIVTLKRPVTPSQDDDTVRVTRSKTPRKTEENLTTPKRAAKQTSPKTPRSATKTKTTPARATPKRLQLGSQPKNPQTPEFAKNKKVNTPRGSQTKSAKKKAKQINKQGRVDFKIVGRLSTENSDPKDQPIKFVQLGLLADKQYGSKGWPTLQDLIKEKQRQLEEDSEKVYSWLHGDKSHSDLIPFQVDAHLPVLRNDHIDQFLSTNMDQDNTPHMVDDKIVDNRAAAFDEEELPDPDQFSEFMTGVLGREKSDIFSQDKETKSQEAARIALQELIEKEEREKKELVPPSQDVKDSPVRKSRKRELSNDSNSHDEVPKSRYKRIRTPEETDEEFSNDKLDVIDIPNEVSKKEPKTSLTFQNSFQDSDNVIVIEDSQENQTNNVKKKRQSLKGRKPLVEVCNYQVISGSDIGKVSDATRKEERRSRDSATSEDDHLCTQEILDSNKRAAGVVDNLQTSLARTREVLSSPNTSTVLSGARSRQVSSVVSHDTSTVLTGSRMSSRPALSPESKEPPVEREASPIEKMMTQTMLISPDKIEFDDNDIMRVDNEDVKRIRDSDEEDMFTATPEELPIHRVNRNILQTGRNETVNVVPESNPISQDVAAPSSNQISQDVATPTSIISQDQQHNQVNVLQPEEESVPESRSLLDPASQKEDQESSLTKIGHKKSTKSCSPLKLTNAKFVMSNLPLTKKEVVTRFIMKFQCGILQGSINDETTHVIVKTEKNLYAQRTLKYLQAIGRGLMLVSNLWCEESLAAGRLLDPSKFEVLDAELDGTPGPYLSRIGRQNNQHDLLKDWQIMIVGEITAIPRNDMISFVTGLGAKTVKEYEEFTKDNVKKAVLVDNAECITHKQARKYLRSCHVAFVDKEWLMETLCSWSIRPLLRYMPQDVTRDEVIQLGKYPPEMVGFRDFEETSSSMNNEV